MTELVSILIPAYKAEAFIGDTIQSARAQTWPRKEIIVVDDGSPDRTYEIARSLESRDVKIVRQEHAGAPTARNTAFSLAQGEYIQWLDADDLLDPGKIANQLTGAESGLTSRTLLTSAWAKFFFRTDKAVFAPDSLWQDLSPIDWIVTKFEDNVWMNPTAWLVSRRLIELAGPWDPRLARSGDDDGEYICRVVGAGEHVQFVPHARCYHRIGVVGSLKWRKEIWQQDFDSLMLSLITSVKHLRRLEDSPRTKAAAARYLQTGMLYFYGCDDRFYEGLAAVARELGHELRQPRASWKYYPLEAIAGPNITRTAIANWRAAKILMRRSYDKFFYWASRRSVS